MLKKNIAVLTGGGDCPGLNSVLYGILLKATKDGHSVIGIEKDGKAFSRTVLLNLT